MRTTLSFIKADVGSIGGHVAPSKHLVDVIRDHVTEEVNGLIDDYYITSTGDDVGILMVHAHGEGNA
jgi:fructose 1,6-bisphosphate aldolase/phosphatase